MITYDSGYWGVHLIFQINGSVLPKALAWAVPIALVTFTAHLAVHQWEVFPKKITGDEGDGINYGIGGYTMVLGFLLVFRTREAYNRWWESITLLQTTRGEWFGAYSNLLAFCSHEPAKREAVVTFQHQLVRLMSLLYGSAIDQVSTVVGAAFDIVDLEGLDEAHLAYLAKQEDKVDIVLQWIQQLIVTKHRSGVLDIAAPILSRVFQELSRGKVNITNARKLSEFPFPFPYAQLLAQALLIQWVITPLLMLVLCESPVWAAALAFTSNLFLWSINYVGEEIEEPFGDDSNDLPLRAMQRSYNNSLAALMMRYAQNPPGFNYDDSHRNLRITTFKTGSDRMSCFEATSELLRRQSTNEQLVAVPEDNELVLASNTLTDTSLNNQNSEKNSDPKFSYGSNDTTGLDDSQNRFPHGLGHGRPGIISLKDLKSFSRSGTNLILALDSFSSSVGSKRERRKKKFRGFSSDSDLFDVALKYIKTPSDVVGGETGSLVSQTSSPDVSNGVSSGNGTYSSQSSQMAAGMPAPKVPSPSGSRERRLSLELDMYGDVHIAPAEDLSGLSPRHGYMDRELREIHPQHAFMHRDSDRRNARFVQV